MTPKVTPPSIAGPIIKIDDVTETNDGNMHQVVVTAEVSDFSNASPAVECALYEPGNPPGHKQPDNLVTPFTFTFIDGDIPANSYNINVRATYVVGRNTWTFSADAPRDAF